MAQLSLWDNPPSTPTPTLIVGSSGSGKTESLIERLAALYEAGPFSDALVLVPTVRHGDQFRRRLVSRCGVALGLRVETVGQFSRGLVIDSWVPPHALVEELLTRTIRSQVETGAAAYFEPIAGTKGLSNLVRTAVRDLLAEGVAPHAMSEAANRSGAANLIALGTIYTAYVTELQRLGWVHPSQIGVAASQAIEAGAPLPGVIVLDGFHLFRGTELVLLQAVAGRADVVIALDPNASTRSRHDYERLLRLLPSADVVELQHSGNDAPQTVIAGEAADREGQLRAIARQIKQRLTDELSLRPSDFAVAFRQASPQLSLARQVFSEYDLPLDPAAGERLNARPLGVWLRRLLHLAEDGWRVRDLASVLSGGFVDLDRWGLSSSYVAQFTQYARENHLWAGPEALGRIVEGLRLESEKDAIPEAPRERMRRTSQGIASALDALRGLLEPLNATTAEHARRLEGALFGENAIIRVASRQGGQGADVELDTLRGYLQDMVSTHEALGGEPESFLSFRARLESKLDAPAVLIREAGGVLLAPMHTLHGLRFDFVAVGGLIAGEFPAPRTSAGLLNGTAIDALNQAGLGLPPEPRLTEDELWSSVSTRADRTLAPWKTRLDERGRPASGSYYYPAEVSETINESRLPTPERSSSKRELAIACSHEWASRGHLRPRDEPFWPTVRLAATVESRRRSFGHAGEYEGKLVLGLAPWLTRTEVRWSASRLESYQTCAFQFFGQYGLGLRELEQELDGHDAAIRGTVIHDVLRDALEPLIARHEPLSSSTLGEILPRLDDSGRQIWNQAPAHYGFGRSALWRLEAERAIPQMEILLQKEAERSEQLGVTRIFGAEKDIVASLPLDPPLQVFGKIDRIDLGDDFVVIVDYKSGHAIKESEVLQGRRVQLQLYGYLGREEAKASRVIARYSWLNPRDKVWELDSDKPDHSEALERILSVAQGVRGSVDSGDFRVNPQVPCPSYCSMRYICRVNQFSRWKHWD